MTSPYDVFVVILDVIFKAGLFGGFISISVFAYQIFNERRRKEKESKERLCRVCNALRIEIDNLDNWYNSEEYDALKTRRPSQRIITTAPNLPIQYSQNIINTAPYDGIVNSGLITYLKEETQKKLNEYYFLVTMHNKRMYDLAQIFNNKASSLEIETVEDEEKITLSLAWHLNEGELTKYEEKMKELTPELKKLLDDEIKSIK